MSTPPAARPYRMWQTEFLSWWLGVTYPRARFKMTVRLGPLTGTMSDPTLTPAEQRLVGAAWRRWADAIVVLPHELLVVECDLIPKPGVISQLQAYLALVDSTPELATERLLPRRGVLLWAVGDPFTEALAARAGLSVVVARPPHFQEWLGTVRARERRPLSQHPPFGS